MVWNRTVLDIETLLAPNWTAGNRTLLTKSIYMLNCIVWIRTVWLNWIAWNRTVSDDFTVYLCKNELFKRERFICVNMDLALNNLQKLMCHKNKQTK